MWDFNAFILELESNFGPHDPIGDAKNLLTNLTMNENSKILKYNVEFWKLAAWSALVVQYFSGLPLHLHIEVMRGGKPNTLGALRLKAQDADDIYWMQKNEMNHSSGNSETLGNSGHSGMKNEPKFTPNNNPNNYPSHYSNSVVNSRNSAFKVFDKPAVNALIEKLDKNGKLTSEEREHCIKENLCLYCGKYGHKASECNKAAAKRRVTTIDSRVSIESNN